jgi:hypothetical protein
MKYMIPSIFFSKSIVSNDVLGSKGLCINGAENPLVLEMSFSKLIPACKTDMVTLINNFIL